MTEKEIALETIRALPDDSSLDEIAEELRLMAAIRRGRADVAAGRAKSHAEVEQSLESWASAWNSK